MLRNIVSSVGGRVVYAVVIQRVWLSAFVLTMLAAAAYGQITFRRTGDLNTTGGSERVAQGDINNDGINDYATTNILTELNIVRIRLGNGTGVTNAPDLVSPGNKGGIKFADFNRDGKLDLAYSGLSDGTLRTRLGNGDGTFAAEVNVGKIAPQASSYSINALDVGDINGDGFIDIATGNEFNVVTVSFGNGDGTFSRYITTDILGVGSLQVIDIDGDGGADVVCNSRFSSTDLVTLTKYRNGLPIIDGTNLVPGGLPGTAPIVVAPSPNGLVFAAFERGSSGRVVVGRNPGGNPIDITVLPNTYDNSGTGGIADFDGDNIPDLVVGEYNRSVANASIVRIIKGSSSGSPFGSIISTFDSFRLQEVTPADFNNDGRRDVIVIAARYDVSQYGGYSVFLNIPSNIVVTTGTDEDNGNAEPSNGNGTSLREAINFAQQSSGAWTISFAPNLGNASTAITFAVELNVGRTATNDPITIENNFGKLTLSGGNNRRVLIVGQNGKLNLRNITIADGFHQTFGGAGLTIQSGAIVNIENCTFTNNRSNNANGSAISADGNSNVTVRNSTFSGNIGKGTIRSIGNLTLEHATVAINSARESIGGILLNPTSGTANLTLRNSVVAANGGGDLSYNSTNVSGTNNILSVGANGNGLTNTIFADPLIDLPADNGGRTLTMKPQSGSPMVNAGAAIGVVTDQRGISRADYGVPDIGAFEARFFTPYLNQLFFFAPNNAEAAAVNLNQVLNPTPAGGTFSGSGVSGNIFNPAGQTPGDKTITYRIASQPNYDLTNPATSKITVFGPPTVTANPADQTVNQGDTVSFSALATGLYAGDAPNSMASGATLTPGQFLLSDNRGFQLIYQGDGNLVLYRANGAPLWASNTATNAPGFVAMQGDGNFVIYNSSGQAQFSTNTAGNPGARLLLQGDGNLVIYSADNEPIYATNSTISGTNPTTSVQWQVSTNGGTNYSNISGANNPTLTVSNVTTADDNKRFRAVFTNAAGQVSTGAARLSVRLRATTTAIISESADPTLQGQTFTVFYNVAVSGSVVPTGNVTVSDGVDSCTATVASGQCSLALNTAGNRVLTATYAGDANFGGSVSAGEPHTVSAPLILVVDTISDDGNLNACTTAVIDCSLRGAINRANGNLANDTINFDSSLFSVARTITLTNGQLTVANNGALTINGTRADRLTVSGNNASRVFEVASGANLVLLKMTVSNGREVFGGGINNHGTLALNTVTVTGNTATNGGGGINSDTGTVTNISNSAITNNTAASNAGGLYFYFAATVNIFNTTVSGNIAGNFGGGITNESSTIQMTNATVTNNTSVFGGGVYNFSGGTIYARNDLIAGNTAGNAPDFSGTLVSQAFNLIGNTNGTTITGDPNSNLLNVDAKLLPLSNYGGETTTHALLPDSPAINAGTADNVPDIDQRGRSRVGTTDIGAYEAAANTIVTNTASSGAGSLLAAVTAANATASDESITFAIPSNDPNCASGVCRIQIANGLDIGTAAASGSLLISNNTGAANIVVAGNTARAFTSNAGNLTLHALTVTGGRLTGGSSGGGIYNAGYLTLGNMLFTDNQADNGGGIANQGFITVVNSTVSGNSANTIGGGIYNTGGVMTLTNSTVANNYSDLFGGGIAVSGGTFNLKNTLVAGNAAPQSGPDFQGSLTSLGYNFIGNTSATQINGSTTGNILNQNARLAPLGFYGGKTLTHALLSNSPAINAGTSINSPFLDQRGAARIGAADIGAFELNSTQNGGNFAATLPNGTQNANYNFTLASNSGALNYSITNGALPNGLSLTGGSPSSTVAVSGVPMQSGVFNFAITATDGTNSNVTNYTLPINSAVQPLSYKADVASRPNGDGQIQSNDVVQMLRFFNELDVPNNSSNEFQRADSAPRTSGDGVIDSSDVVQTIRYLNELDPLQSFGGARLFEFDGGAIDNQVADQESKQSEKSFAPQVAPELRVESRFGSAGNQTTVNIRVDAVGNEAQYGFAVLYDPNVLTYTDFAAGTTTSGTFSCNTTATVGRLRCSIGAFSGNQPGTNPLIGEIAAGDNQILIKIIFTVNASATPNTATVLTLTGQSASNENAVSITPAVTNGTITVSGATAAGVSISGRVILPNDLGLTKALVTLTDPNGVSQTTMTNKLGNFNFREVAAGRTYILSVSAKRYTFTPQIFSLTEDLSGITFTPQ